MKISLRLTKIANMVEKGSTLLDVGTDHAYIPIYLCQSQTIQRAIASDISKGPVENAKNNVKNHCLQDKIDVRLGDGLKTTTKQDLVDTCIIAGMGGSLITKILEQSKELVDTFSNLILQPQKSQDKVRKYLHKIKFKIVKDEMFIDDDRIYTLIVAKKGTEDLYTEEEYLFGKYEIQKKCPILKEYISLEMYKMEKVLNQIKQSSSDFAKIESKYNIYKEVIKCL